MSFISCDISVVVIIRKCHTSYLSIRHNIRSTPALPILPDERLVICVFFAVSLVILASWRCLWKISSQCYLIVFNFFLVMIIIVNINTSIWSCSWASRKTLVCTYFGCLLSVSYTVFVLTFCQKSIFSYVNTPPHVLVHKWKVMQMHLHNPAHAVKDLTADWT